MMEIGPKTPIMIRLRKCIPVLFLWSISHPASAQLAAMYPNDAGIENDPDVLYVEKFEDGKDQILSRYTDVLNPFAILLDPDVPPGSPGNSSIRMTSAPGSHTGAHLFRHFQPGFDGTVYVRYYVKYPSTSKNYFHHEGIWMGGYNPSTPWPNPGAGLCGMGDKRLSIAFEPVWHNTDPPGMDTYLYWGDMKSWNDGTSCYGNVMVTQGALEYSEPLVTGDYPEVNFDNWMCVEIMVKLNDPVTAFNGELAIWVDGQQIGHWGPGFPNGHWLKDRWYNNPADPPFEGFRWRTNAALDINWLWIEYFHSNPVAPPSHILYDHIVVAKEYIGPIHTVSHTESPAPSADVLHLYPHPARAAQPLTLKTGAPGKAADRRRVRIAGMAGEIVYDREHLFEQGKAVLQLPDWPEGMYFLQISDEVNVTGTRMVIAR